MSKEFEILDKNDWPKNVYIPVATIEYQPQHFIEKNKMMFFQSEEQIGPVQTAYLKLQSGLFVMLMFVEFTPEEGISICIQESLSKPLKNYLNEIIDILSLSKEVISWKMNQSDWECLGKKQ